MKYVPLDDGVLQVTLQDILHATERENGPLYRRARAITNELTKRSMVIASVHDIQERAPARRAGFYRGVQVGQEVEYARDQVQRGLVISDEQVKLLREYEPDALADTPYDK